MPSALLAGEAQYPCWRVRPSTPNSRLGLTALVPCAARTTPLAQRAGGAAATISQASRWLAPMNSRNYLQGAPPRAPEDNSNKSVSTFTLSPQWHLALCASHHRPHRLSRRRRAPPRRDGYPSLVSPRRVGSHSSAHPPPALCAASLLFTALSSTHAAGRRRRLRPSRLPIRRALLPRCAASPPHRCPTRK